MKTTILITVPVVIRSVKWKGRAGLGLCQYRTAHVAEQGSSGLDMLARIDELERLGNAMAEWTEQDEEQFQASGAAAWRTSVSKR